MVFAEGETAVPVGFRRRILPSEGIVKVPPRRGYVPEIVRDSVVDRLLISATWTVLVPD